MIITFPDELFKGLIKLINFLLEGTRWYETLIGSELLSSDLIKMPAEVELNSKPQ